MRSTNPDSLTSAVVYKTRAPELFFASALAAIALELPMVWAPGFV